MEYKVALTRQADQDLIRIWRFIAKDNPSAATSFCLELAQQAYALKNLPDRTSELAFRPEIRKIPYKSYLIFYRIKNESQGVEILRFWHAARDQRRLRLKEETTQPYQVAKQEA